jgi:hypothetical protein
MVRGTMGGLGFRGHTAEGVEGAHRGTRFRVYTRSLGLGSIHRHAGVMYFVKFGPSVGCRMYQNVSKYIKMYQNVSKYIKMYQNVSKYIKMYQIVSKYIKMYQIVSKYIKMYQNVSKCSIMYQKV